MKKALTAVLLCLLVLAALSFACAEEDTGIHLPSSLIDLKDEVFAGTAIEEVYLPKTLVAVSDKAFADAKNLEAIHFSGNTLLLQQGGTLRISGRRTRSGREKAAAGQGPVFCAGQPGHEDDINKKAERLPAGDGQEDGTSVRPKAAHSAKDEFPYTHGRPELPPVDYCFP